MWAYIIHQLNSEKAMIARIDDIRSMTPGQNYDPM